MNASPKSLRLHLAIVGRSNVGKSSLLNMLSGQDVSIVSSQTGTTTDVVEKTMELLPIGPVVFLDTAGVDDTTVLSQQRLAKTEKVFERADVVLLILKGDEFTEFESNIRTKAITKNIPLILISNYGDCRAPHPEATVKTSAIDVNQRESMVTQLKAALLKVCPEHFLSPPPLVGDLVRPGGLVVMVVPIDLQAPKGRLILPQVSAIRDILDNDAATLVVKEREMSHMMDLLKQSPDLVICDSQVVLKMVADTPPKVPCTTFSILFARLKGDLIKMAEAAAVIDHLRDGDRILIAESCSHHAAEDDIGRVKIPRWLRQYCGSDLRIDTVAGRDFPENIGDYSLVIQCGGCMQNRREMLSRQEHCEQVGVPLTNYGLAISLTQGVLRRVLSPFPAALDAFDRAQNRGRKPVGSVAEHLVEVVH
jgi:[FeFe] hydrogenase H-cluster maturation GTPase HydF